MIPLIVVLGLGSAAAYAHHRRSKIHGMTPERKKLYESALKGQLKPEALRELAGGFEQEGLTNEAEMLRKRAALKEIPKDQKKARNQAFRTAIGSDDPEGIEELASAFEEQGATGAAARLKERAAALRQSEKS
jgi:hypothetical protein